MVFLVREILTEEDWAAWRELATQRERVSRKKHRSSIRGWLGNKLCGIANTVFGTLMLCAVVSGGMKTVWAIWGLILMIAGLWIFLAAGRYPATRDSLFVRSGLPSFRDSEFADPGCIFRGWLFRFLGCFREDSIEVFIHSLRVGGQGAVLSLFSGSFAPGFAEARFCPLYTREFPGPSGTGIGTACGKIDR